MSPKDLLEELPERIKTIKLNVRTWSSLKNLKKENETFNDVIKDLLKERTISINKGGVETVKYHRKVLFLKTEYNHKPIGIEFEYNDVKNQQQNFTLDLKIKKVFYGKRSLNPSIFFGLNIQHKHLHPVYLNLYLKCVYLTLEKEFKVRTRMYEIILVDEKFEDIAKWRKIYYDYSLSEESFINDIEEPLRLSEEETLTEKYKENINKSMSASIWEIK